MNLALKDIQYSPARFVLTALGIGLLLMVVMGMGGIYRGIIEDATLLPDSVGADLWVVQRDTRGPFAELSRVPKNLVHRVSAVPGVREAREFVFHTIQRERHGKPLRLAVLGLSWPTDKGEWVPLIAGRPLGQRHFEMLADRSLGFALGEQVKFGKETYRVVGVCENMMGTSGDGLAFFTVSDAQAIQFDTPGEAIRLERAAREARGERSEFGTLQPSLLAKSNLPSKQLPAIARPQISAVMLSLSPGVTEQQVAEVIAGWGDVSVYTQQEQRNFLIQGSVEKVRRQIGLIRILLTLVAAIVMALILYTLTLDKIHSIALLKLIGAPNTVILGLIMQQGLVLGGLGFFVAFALGVNIFPLFPRRVILTQADLIQLGFIVLVISVASSVLGIRKALSVSPNEALA